MPARKPRKMPAAWLDRFDREMTDQTLAIALGYCNKLVGAINDAERIEDQRSHHDYVNAAILDTMQGIRTWDPDRVPPVPLYRHLCRIVYSRVYHDRQRYKRQRHVPYHEVDIDGESSVETMMSLQRDDERKRPEGRVMLRELHVKGWGWLRAAAEAKSSETDVVTLIGFLEVGVTSEPEIRERTGWTEQRYQNTQRRFATLVRRMPDELKEALRDAVARAPVNTGADWRKSKGTEVGARADEDEPELYERDPDEDGDPDDAGTTSIDGEETEA